MAARWPTSIFGPLWSQLALDVIDERRQLGRDHWPSSLLGSRRGVEAHPRERGARLQCWQELPEREAIEARIVELDRQQLKCPGHLLSVKAHRGFLSGFAAFTRFLPD
jgi:hypothetical protein